MKRTLGVKDIGKKHARGELMACDGGSSYGDTEVFSGSCCPDAK